MLMECLYVYYIKNSRALKSCAQAKPPLSLLLLPDLPPGRAEQDQDAKPEVPQLLRAGDGQPGHG